MKNSFTGIGFRTESERGAPGRGFNVMDLPC